MSFEFKWSNSGREYSSVPLEVEKVGEKLRAMMPWIQKGKMVDKDKN